ncbi:LPS O-antigen length regulator Wzz(fepE) [Escherichia sp. E1130]|uniref:LPS O-antigen length regulator Wzz(fepE) n=1 Tax=Escherichia sp. E1130 TaxID=2041645 RepID=UPI00108058FA|nr:LPS O-antigen length regulator Wzz(fepE) [Escherichia sp. E1130]TGC24407.1 LPS O-antigen length regulator [Escherichia sp. E1130]TLI62928.1 LPS O-antigen length regulator [Escherichia sp. E1130]
MSSPNVKPKKNMQLTDVHIVQSKNNEIDLLKLILSLYNAKVFILITILIFSCVGLFVTSMLPQKWTSIAIVTPAETVQWGELEKKLTSLQVLGLGMNVDRSAVFDLFIKKFQSTLLLEKYLTSSVYVMNKLKNGNIDKINFYRTTSALSEKMKSASNNSKNQNHVLPYTSWMLMYTGQTSEEAQVILSEYIDYISNVVVKDFMNDIRNKLEIKIQTEKEMLALERIKIRNHLDTDIQRLNYSLEVARAAGIKKPIYSNGQAVRDDPDFSISLGTDGIERKLKIKKNITDISELNSELRNREYFVQQLTTSNIGDIKFIPFQYQATPSFPMKKDGPSKEIIVFLSAVVGCMVACSGVLLRHTTLSSKDVLIMR